MDFTARHCKGYNAKDPSTGAFQKYTVVPKNRIAELPYEIPTSTGVVLPLGISTAAAGLYQEGFLALDFPTVDDEDSITKSSKRTLLVWGGSSSVGSCTIQLAVASGAEVITTASPDNFEYCKKLGASQCFDYHDDDVEDQIVDALDGKTVLGAYDAIGKSGAPQACARILDRSKGKAILVTVRGVPDEGIPDSVRAKASKSLQPLDSRSKCSILMFCDSVGSSAIFDNDVGPYIWREFLPKALDKKKLIPQPEPLIVGEELRSVQAGLDRQKKGVSAKKVVVTHIS